MVKGIGLSGAREESVSVNSVNGVFTVRAFCYFV